jgi:hypothetical protein
MFRTQIQLPAPLHARLQTIAARHGWSMADVLRMAAEHFADRFSMESSAWRFPTLDCGGDFLTDPARLHPETL